MGRNNFKPSITLKEFAEQRDLNLFALRAKVAADDSIQCRYTRGLNRYYHIRDLRFWILHNEVPVNAPV